jgi:hypothetical protein
MGRLAAPGRYAHPVCRHPEGFAPPHLVAGALIEDLVHTYDAQGSGRRQG